jgi:hypothetical protein
MSLPASWVDALFAKLTVRYGLAFMRQWPDADPDLIKADWAEVLDGVSGDAIAYALAYLPVTPVTALQFREICRKRPEGSDLMRLPPPRNGATPEFRRSIMARIRRGLGPRLQAGEGDCQ